MFQIKRFLIRWEMVSTINQIKHYFLIAFTKFGNFIRGNSPAPDIPSG